MAFECLLVFVIMSDSYVLETNSPETLLAQSGWIFYSRENLASMDKIPIISMSPIISDVVDDEPDIARDPKGLNGAQIASNHLGAREHIGH